MNIIKLSLVAVIAISSTFAGGNIDPVDPVESVVAAPVAVADCNKDTTVAGKLVGYYITDDSKPSDDMFGDHAQLGTAATLDVSHKLFDNVSLNFGAVGYLNTFNKSDQNYGYLEGSKNGAFFNVANITATYADTTLVAGRQLLDTPMLGGFDWLLAPGAFEAITLSNSSIDKLALVGSYLTKHRGNNTGDNFTKLTDDNFAFGASYSDGLDASVWYYNVDAADYTQIYGDLGYDFGSFNVAGQVISTDTTDDSMAYGAKIGTKLSGVNLSAAVNMVSDAETLFIGRDSLYTSSWNRFASKAFEANEDTLSWKVGASTELAGANLEASYAGYGDEGSELDLIVGYDITNSVNLGAVYTLTDYDTHTAKDDADNALEVFASYSF